VPIGDLSQAIAAVDPDALRARRGRGPADRAPASGKGAAVIDAPRTRADA